MRELCHRARAYGADVVRLVADRLQHRQELLEDALVAADPDGELSGLRSAGPPAYGCIEEVDALLAQILFDLAHAFRGIRAEVEPRRAVRQDALQFLRHGLDFSGSRQRREK